MMRAAKREKSMQGALLGTLAELIEVPEQYEAAVEAVLTIFPPVPCLIICLQAS